LTHLLGFEVTRSLIYSIDKIHLIRQNSFIRHSNFISIDRTKNFNSGHHSKLACRRCKIHYQMTPCWMLCVRIFLSDRLFYSRDYLFYSRGYLFDSIRDRIAGSFALSQAICEDYCSLSSHRKSRIQGYFSHARIFVNCLRSVQYLRYWLFIPKMYWLLTKFISFLSILTVLTVDFTLRSDHFWSIFVDFHLSLCCHIWVLRSIEL
jgi:hypothetical protein